MQLGPQILISSVGITEESRQEEAAGADAVQLLAHSRDILRVKSAGESR